MADFDQALKINPNYAEAYNNRGIVYRNKGDYNKAIADFEAVLRIDPNNIGAKIWLSTTRRLLGH
jgi:lipoprotein NlpI